MLMRTILSITISRVIAADTCRAGAATECCSVYRSAGSGRDAGVGVAELGTHRAVVHADAFLALGGIDGVVDPDAMQAGIHGHGDGRRGCVPHRARQAAQAVRHAARRAGPDTRSSSSTMSCVVWLAMLFLLLPV